MLTSQNNIVFFVLFISLIFAVLAAFLVSLVFINARNNARKQTDLLHAMMKSQEDERERIARDLHDELGMQFMAIKMHVGLLGDPDFEANESVSHHNTQQMIDNVMNDLRLIIHNLLPASFARYGLVAQLDDLKKSLHIAHNIIVKIAISNREQRYKYEFEINLFRMLQEMINNTLKYAQATTISIGLDNANGDLKVEYMDNGCGFDVEEVKKGLGIQNIQTRVNFFHGRLQLNSKPSEGTTYIIIFDKKHLQPLYVNPKPPAPVQSHSS